MFTRIFLSAALVAGLTQPVVAQEPAEATSAVQAGATVYGSDGGAIGTVERAEGEVVLLAVGERHVPVPAGAIASRDKGPTLNITRAALVSQFDQQVAKYEAQLNAALKAGAAVQTADAQPLGVIKQVSDDTVVVDGDLGSLNLPRALFGVDQQGGVVARASLGDIKNAMAATPTGGR